jgi:hypothetical protein
MAEVNRVADTRANASDYQSIIAVTRANFRQTSQLRPTEVRSCG